MNSLGWIWYLIYYGGVAALLGFGVFSMIKHRKSKGSLSNHIRQARNGRILSYGLFTIAVLMFIILIIAMNVK